jgi:hypothetical protein
MKIYLVSKYNVDEMSYLGDSNSLPIPRIGEGIILGFEPIPLVTHIVYDYKQEIVYVGIDGTLRFTKGK